MLLAPAFSGLTALAAYLLTSELSTSPSAGLLAAAFMGITPGYISRSVAGSYDNEAIAIFLLVFTFYLWIKSLREGSTLWAALTALFYFYMVASWGGYVFITNLIPLHAFVLVVMGRYSPRLYVSYSTWYALGTLASMQIPFVGFLPIRSSEHMAALGEYRDRRPISLCLSARWANASLVQASLASCRSSDSPTLFASRCQVGSFRPSSASPSWPSLPSPLVSCCC